MSKKGTKKCCVCGCYDEPRYRVFDGFVCSDCCLNQREATKENRISSHRCEVCGKELINCRIEDVYVSPDYNSGDDRDIVFLCSTDCYAYYHELLVHETPAYARLDDIVQKRKAAELAELNDPDGINDKARELVINPKKLSDEEAKETYDKITRRINDILTDRIKDMLRED